MKRELSDLVGKEINHKKYGICQVVEILNLEEYKILIKVIKDASMRKVIFSNNFFEGIDDYKYLSLPKHVKVEKRVYKGPDYKKIRSHPLVKEIDAREQRLRVIYEPKDADDDDNEEE